MAAAEGGNVLLMVMALNVLEKSINKRVQLLLKDNRILEGKLVGYDDYMNMVLEDTEETKEDNVRRVGTVVLRGNNVVTIVPKGNAKGQKIHNRAPSLESGCSS